jgi:N-acetylneuraminic acid mutarotase
VRARFRYNGSAAACGTGSYDDHDDLVFAVAPPPPDFSVAAAPSSLTIAQGASGTSTVTVSSLNGFGSAVGLSCSGLPSGVTCGFSPSSVTPPAGGSASSTLTVSASTSAAAASSTFSVVGTSGALTRSTSLSLTVTPAGGGSQTAIYDATLKAPKCAAVGSSCDSGPSLLLGRNTKGPEPNQPNTINASCADGNSGTFHVDESNDRIKVSTLDGTSFAPGKTVRIDATVWAWTAPSTDHLDLYYAANAQSPAWTFVGTLTPTAAGARTLSATYTLPTGPLQAVRAQFRYQGSAAACTIGGYNDRDDLVFAVNPTAAEGWTATSTTNAPPGLKYHTAVWTGSRMIVWGGVTSFPNGENVGGVYNPATDTWTSTSTVNVPSGRYGHTAVWTGSKMIVWGGHDGLDFIDTGAIYDPATDTWTPTSTLGASLDRNSSTVVWTGSKMIVWGGDDGSEQVNTGQVYNPATDTWTAMSTVGAPSGRYVHTAVSTGSKMVVWGGFGCSPCQELDTGGVYDPTTDTWTAMSTVGAPSAREGHSAVWTGSSMIVWGGYDSFGDYMHDTGGIYSPPGI